MHEETMTKNTNEHLAAVVRKSSGVLKPGGVRGQEGLGLTLCAEDPLGRKQP